MPGPAEQVIRAEHQDVVDSVRAVVATPTAMYRSASAFRFVFEPTVRCSSIDSSAVAASLGVLVDAAIDLPLSDLLIGCPTTATDEEIGQGPGSSYADPWAAGAVVTAERQVAAAVASAVGDDVAEGCRAFENGWYEEAEDAFLRGANRRCTDPLPWFGAGVAAAKLDPVRAATHLVRAGRYLLPVDPPGSAYVTIVAAALHEQAGEKPTAVRLLLDGVKAIDAPCPGLLLHLARLDDDPESRLADALACDALLDADIQALGIDGGDAAKEKRRGLEREFRELDASIEALRRLDGGPAWSDDSTLEDPLASGEGLSLARLEVLLWGRVDACRDAVAAGGRLVDDLEAARRAKEADVVAAKHQADTDLVHHTATRFFFSSLLIAFSIIGLLVVGELFRSVVHPGAVSIVIGIGQLALLAQAVNLFLRMHRPRRSLRRARQAKSDLPRLQAQAAVLRNNEFETAKRFRRINHDAQAVLGEITGRRSFVVPARPTFGRQPGSE